MSSKFQILSIFLIGLFLGVIGTCLYDDMQKNKQDGLVEVVSVYDGDTFKVNLTGENPIFGESLSIRLRGIDTPEIRGGTEESKARAIEARDFLANMLSGNVVTIHNLERGKYFRIVADVKAGGIDVVQVMLKRGLGKPYKD